jgi:hypothetical protein
MNANGHLKLPSETFISPLLELRDYYARLAEEHERLFIQARSQLDHVEALLSNWSFPHGNEQIPRLDAVNGNGASAPKVSLLLLSPDSVSDSDVMASRKSQLPDADSLVQEHFTPVTHELADAPLPIAPAENSSDYLLKGPAVPMLPDYQALSRMEAIKKLLEEYIGTVCHIDFIVRSLYGELEPHIFKVVKGRVQSSLTQGRERDAWSTIPNEPGCYTLDLGLIIPSGTSINAKHKRKKPFFMPKPKVVPLLKTYEGQFLIDAITSFLKHNPGRAFSVAEVVAGIYGKLDSQELREVKNKVLNELSRGHRTGRFSRVPDKIGFYTGN